MKQRVDRSRSRQTTAKPNSSQKRRRNGARSRKELADEALDRFGERIERSLSGTGQAPRAQTDPTALKAIARVRNDSNLSRAIQGRIITLFLRFPEMAGGYLAVADDSDLAEVVLQEMMQQLSVG